MTLNPRPARDVRQPRAPEFEPDARPVVFRWPAAALLALMGVWIGIVAAPLSPVPSPWTEWVGETEPAPRLPRPWPQSIAATAARHVEGTVRSGSTLLMALGEAGLTPQQAQEILHAASDAIDPRRVRAGQTFRVYFDASGDVAALRYPIDRQSAWFVAHENGDWQASKVVIPVQVRPAFITATITGSLEGALTHHLRSRRDVHELALRVADIFGWDVDFTHDLQHGDRLDMVVEERWIEDEFVGYGEIVAAEFRVLGRILPVVAFRDDDGTMSYFTPDGQSVRRRFLRSPVRFDRISSRFSPRRVHPVTGVPRAHRGVDYVANPGTPVQATADGVVLEAAYGAEPGRYVKIRHGGSYSTIYMHLSRYAEGIKSGVAVKQGQVVGYVGKTGSATGYHLHYGLIQGERYVDPLELQMPAAEPIAQDNWSAFAEQRERWFGMLRDGQSRLDVQVAGAGGL